MLTKRVIFIIHGLILSLCFCLGSEEPFSIYLTWKQNPESSMNIQWVSTAEDKSHSIEYKAEDEEIWQKSEGRQTLMPSQESYRIHFVDLTDLKPATSYHFRIGQEDSVYKFRTMPLSTERSIRFIVGGDMYNGSIEMLEKTNRAAAAADPLFVVIGGDIAYSCSGSITNHENSEKWLDWLSVWKKTMVTPDGYLIPIVPAIGNHEVRGGKDGTAREAEMFFALFPFPGLEGYNVLDFCHYMSLIILDSGHTNPILGTQSEWLKRILQERCSVPYKFAVYHIPAYPSFRKYYAKSSWSIRQHWVPSFEKFGLTAAFENNDHAYKRTHPILRGKTHPRGILYMGDGAWAVGNVRKPKTPKQAWYIAKSVAAQYFMLITIQNNHIHYQAWTPEGALIDEIKSTVY